MTVNEKGNENNIELKNHVEKEKLYLYSTEVIYDIDLVREFILVFFAKRIYMSLLINIGLSLFGILLVTLNYKRNALPIGLILIIGGLVGLLRTLVNRKKIIKIHMEALKKEPNKKYKYLFYSEYMDIEMKSDVSSSTQEIRYKDIQRVIEKEKYIYLQYLNKYYTIYKNSLGEQLNNVLVLLKSHVNDFKSPKQ